MVEFQEKNWNTKLFPEFNEDIDNYNELFQQFPLELMGVLVVNDIEEED